MLSFILVILSSFSWNALAAPDALQVAMEKAKKEASKTPRATLIGVGKRIYSRRCARCHGVPGKSSGRSFFDSGARDLSKAVYKYRSTPSGYPPADIDIWRSITRGVPHTSMPNFKFLAPRDRWALVEYLKSLSEDFDDEDPPPVLKVPPEPPVNQASRDAGKNWYVLSRCFECHGASGAGDGAMSKSLYDAEGRKVRPAAFSKGRFRSGSAGADLYRTLHTGLDGTPMAAYGEGSFLWSRESQRLKKQGKRSKKGDFRYPVLEAVSKLYDQAFQKSLKKAIDELPTQAELDKMTPKEKTFLDARRRWELVQYLQALAGKKL